MYRVLGRTGLRVSAVSFGAGPVSGLMTGTNRDAQRATVARAIAAGINWFDTAAGYGDGKSESNLGRVLAELGAENIHIATKVRVPSDEESNIGDSIRRSVTASLERLALPRVTLLQLHNGITTVRGSEPASITPSEVLGPVAKALLQLREDGLVQHLGLTGTGEHLALTEVIKSGLFDTLQVPYNILNPSAGNVGASSDGETNYGNVIADCAAVEMGVFAIRVFAGGAVLGQPPSAHTLQTQYFPLALFERDTLRAQQLRERCQDRLSPAELALRFALSHPHVTSAIIGFGTPDHVDQLAASQLDQPLPLDFSAELPRRDTR